MKILFCSCGNRDQTIGRERVDLVRNLLLARHCELTEVPDLCGLAARRGTELPDILRSGIEAIAACHPRAVKWLFAGAGAPLPKGFPIFDMRDIPPDDPVGRIDRWLADIRARTGEEACGVRNDGKDVPVPVSSDDGWFPIIDYDRCIACGQCHQFCMFGAYSRDDDGRVTVSSPKNCKLNCPACARICPRNAIIFPKSEDSAINGADLSPEELASAQIRLDLQRRLAGNPYEVLRARQARRRGTSIIRPGALEGQPESDRSKGDDAS